MRNAYRILVQKPQEEITLKMYSWMAEPY